MLSRVSQYLLDWFSSKRRCAWCCCGLLLLAGGAQFARAEALVDGDAGDWDAAVIEQLPAPNPLFDPSPAQVEAYGAEANGHCINWLIRYQLPRPGVFGDEETSGDFEIDYGVLELDAFGDGVWDARFELVKGREPGRNNLLVLKSNGRGGMGGVALFPEGHALAIDQAPVARFSEDARTLELCIPRQGLALPEEGELFYRLRTRYRLKGDEGWVTEYYPLTGWQSLQLPPLAPELQETEVTEVSDEATTDSVLFVALPDEQVSTIEPESMPGPEAALALEPIDEEEEISPSQETAANVIVEPDALDAVILAEDPEPTTPTLRVDFENYLIEQANAALTNDVSTATLTLPAENPE